MDGGEVMWIRKPGRRAHYFELNSKNNPLKHSICGTFQLPERCLIGDNTQKCLLCSQIVEHKKSSIDSITVGDLIKELSKFDKSLTVFQNWDAGGPCRITNIDLREDPENEPEEYNMPLKWVELS